MKSFDIVGYTYRAEILCPDCTALEARSRWGVTLTLPGSPENALDQAAALLRIDRQDEHSFDSEDFPKVVFADQLDGSPDELCDRCDRPLIPTTNRSNIA